ncbi:MAG: Spy/CpxP family protein refolding chaperone [Candidatus Saccharibacteria bacterium]
MDEPETQNTDNGEDKNTEILKVINKKVSKLSKILIFIKSNRIYVFIGILVVAIGGVAAFWYFTKNSNTTNNNASSNQNQSTNKSSSTSAANSTDATNLGYTYPTLKYTYNDQYTLDQAMSDNAQLSTIAFDGLAFITGSAGADTFFPPGKVADFFGFQYMRDVDTAGYGHNTTFLSKAANNIIKILNDDQKAKLIALAKEQESIYTNFAYNRMPLMTAFRNSLENKLPSGSTGLNSDVVKAYTGNLYGLDADLSYNRAVVVGAIINSLTDDQKAYLAKMDFNNSATWPDVAEDQSIKTSLTNTQFVAVMTYSSEMFSWYKGSIAADVYYCPERHGTYFGGFYMKDYPAMNNPDYFISTTTTGDKGQGFLDILNTDQKALVTEIIAEQKPALMELTQIRLDVSTELRKAQTGDTIDKTKVYNLINRYGQLDGQMSALYAAKFTAVNKTLTDTQRAALVKLRDLTVVPAGAYMFSTSINTPTIPSTDFFFGVGTMPTTAGQTTAPTGFSTSTDASTPPAK